MSWFASTRKAILFSLINKASVCFRDSNFYFKCQRWIISVDMVAILKLVQQQEMIFLFLYCFCFFRWHYPAANDFGSEIIPLAMKDYNVKVDSQKIIRDHYYLRVAISIICSWASKLQLFVYGGHIYLMAIGKILEL